MAEGSAPSKWQQRAAQKAAMYDNTAEKGQKIVRTNAGRMRGRGG
eukprot:CAMPEP_0205941094 /NCGR_PEP_ID=MMETSP1325-20131115/54016_1 /ASSEMBLY_ACC=CAM_ASM_000708 /TAXON_ID=236786 /ORGANISM="Florenciella sp., Strain RCC1007" /LENGTH=44 /DNA_ID= /DNA_START= /DNA_END= /DNA_ORIENTATION=